MCFDLALQKCSDRLNLISRFNAVFVEKLVSWKTMVENMATIKYHGMHHNKIVLPPDTITVMVLPLYFFVRATAFKKLN